MGSARPAGEELDLAAGAHARLQRSLSHRERRQDRLPHAHRRHPERRDQAMAGEARRCGDARDRGEGDACASRRDADKLGLLAR